MATQFNLLGKRSTQLIHDCLTDHNSGNLAMLLRLNEKSGNPIDLCERYKVAGVATGLGYSQTLSTGVIGVSASGANQIAIGDVAPLDFENTQAFSMMAVVNGTWNSAAYPFFKYDGTTAGYYWRIGSTGLRGLLVAVNAAATDWFAVDSTVALTASATTIIHVTYSGSKTRAGARLFTNGAADTLTNTGTATLTGNSANAISADLLKTFLGNKCAIFGFWDAVLSVEDVARHAYVLGLL